MRMRTLALVLVALGVIAGAVTIARVTGGQQVRASQRGTVTQVVSTTEIRIVYNRPVARGRELFGALVPWGEIWNPGANEATTIGFTHDVRVGGEILAAGRYSVWAIPRPAAWTVIFSRAADVWHAPYPEGADALRITATPQEADHMEVLAFYFPLVEAAETTLVLHWGTTVVPIRIQVEPDQG
jgi:hypothetical protein